NGNVIHPKDLDAGKFKHAEDDLTDGGTSVDHLSTEKDPYYNGNDAKKDSTSRGTSSAAGSTETGMSDAPRYDDDTFPPGVTKATLTFEDCAICKTTGKVLDCITWTYTRVKGDGTDGSITDATGTAGGNPSDEFKKAKEKFDKNHDNDQKCPDA